MGSWQRARIHGMCMKLLVDGSDAFSDLESNPQAGVLAAGSTETANCSLLRGGL